MITSEDMPAGVALLIELRRARQAVQRGRRLPGVPLLAIGRPARGAGGARGPGGELPWSAGRMPPSGADRVEVSVTTSVAIIGTAAAWPAVGQRPDMAPNLPAMAPEAAAPAMPPPPRAADTKPGGVDRLPHHRPPVTSDPAQPAGRHPAPNPPPLAPRPSNGAPGTVLAGRPRRDIARTSPPGLPPLPGEAARPAAVPPQAERPAREVAPPPPGAPAAAMAHPAVPTTIPPAPTGPVLSWAQPGGPRAEWVPPSDPVLVAPAWPAPAGPARAAPGHAPEPTPAAAAAAPAPALVQRDPRAAPASVSTVTALGDQIQRSVRHELDELRAAVTRIGKQSAPPSSPPAPPVAATADTARHLLGRIRTMLHEEQFRRGNIR